MPKQGHSYSHKYFYFTSILMLLTSSIITLSAAEGQLGHGESCDPSPSLLDESKKCDGEKGLSCHHHTSRCECHHEGRDKWDPDSGRCETKVGKFCDPKRTTFCVDNAICNSTTNFCQCLEGFETNDDGSECSGSPHQESSSIFLSTMAVFLLLISVFICT